MDYIIVLIILLLVVCALYKTYRYKGSNKNNKRDQNIKKKMDEWGM